jgi:DNA-binding CsgD family transcriptional regulator
MRADVEGTAPNAYESLTHGMSRTDAFSVAIVTSGVAALGLIYPGEALWYLLVVPIWIVARDFGVTIGFIGAACALAITIPLYVMQDAHGALGSTALAAVFGAAAMAGAGRGTRGVWTQNEDLWLLTARPKIVPRREVLSRRELEVMEMIATGAKNAEIAEQFVISQNTVKSHVSQILKKLAVTNRTEAAYRYTELYGHGSHTTGAGSETAPAAHDEHAEIGAASVVPATVSSVPGSERVLVTMQDGRDLEVPMLESIRTRVEVGASAIVYFDGHDRPVGWYLPELDLGVDMRHWAP